MLEETMLWSWLFCKMCPRSVNEILHCMFRKHSQTPPAVRDRGAVLVWRFRGAGGVSGLILFSVSSSNFTCARSGMSPILTTFFFFFKFKTQSKQLYLRLYFHSNDRWKKVSNWKSCQNSIKLYEVHDREHWWAWAF